MKLTKKEVDDIVYNYDIFDNRIGEVVDIIEKHCNVKIDIGCYKVISDFNTPWLRVFLL